jgi:hypothetical protein
MGAKLLEYAAPPVETEKIIAIAPTITRRARPLSLAMAERVLTCSVKITSGSVFLNAGQS